MGGFSTVRPTAGTAGSTGSGAGGNQNNVISLSIVVDAKTGQATIQSITNSITGLGKAAQQTGQQTQQAGQQALQSAAWWAKLYAQTELVARGFEALNSIFHDTIVESTLIAARTEVLNTVLGVTARNLNYTGAQARAQVKAIQDMNISHQEAIESTLQLTRAQIDLSKATGLARAAQDLAVVAGENSSETLQHITEAIQENNTWMLRQYGIVTYLDTALEQYAAKLNKSAAALTQVERNQAILNLVMVEAQKVQGAYILAMDDAGKAMTSLERITKDTKETVGNAFLPVFLILIHATGDMLTFVKELNPKILELGAALAAGIIVVTGMSAAVFALTTAWNAVKVAALGAAEAEAVAGTAGIAAVAAALPLIPIIAAVGAALTLIAGGMIIFGSKALETEKVLKQQAEDVRTHEESVNNLVTGYDELRKKEEDITAIREKRAQITEHEKNLYPELNAAQNQSLAIASREADVKTARNNLDKEALNIARDAVKVIGSEKDGTQTLVIDQGKLLELQKQAAAATAAQVKTQEQHIAALNKAQILNVQQRDALRQQADEYNKLSVSQRANLDSLGAQGGYLNTINTWIEKLNDGWKQTNDALTVANATLDQMTSKASGLQVLPIGVQSMVSNLSSTVGLVQQIVQAKREGVKVDGQLEILAKNQLSNIFNQKSVVDSLTAKWEEMQRDHKNDAAFLQTQGERYKVLLEGAKQIGSEFENAATSAKSLTDQVTKTSAVLQSHSTMFKMSSDFVGKETTGWIQNGTAILGVNMQIQSMNRENANAAQSQRTENIQLANQQLQAQVQTFDVRRQELDLEKQISESERGRAIQSAVLAGIGGKDLDLFKKELDALREIRKTEGDRRINLEIQNEMYQRQLAYLQEAQNVQGATYESQAKILEMQFDMQNRQAREKLTADTGLAQALYLVWVAYENKLYALFRQEQERERDLAMENNQARIATIEARRNTQGELNATQISAMKTLYDKENVMQKAQLEDRVKNDKFYQDHALQAKEYVDAQEERMDAETDERKRALDENFRQQQMARALKTKEAVLLSSGLNTLEVDRQVKLLSLQQQSADLLRLKILDEKQSADWLTRQTAELNRQVDLQKQQQAHERSVALSQMGGAAGKAGMSQMVTQAKDAQVAFTKARDAYEQSTVTLEALQQAKKEGMNVDVAMAAAQEDVTEKTKRLIESQDQLKNTQLTLNDVFKAWMDGIQVDKLTVLSAAFNQVSGSVLNFFEALGQGEGAGKALKNLATSILKGLAELAMQQAAFWYLAAAADAASVLDAWKVSSDLTAAYIWTAAAAGLGVAAGAASKGGGGGGGGGAQVQLGKGGAQPLAPVNTRTSMEDQIIKLNQNLVVQGRVLQYAGDQYNKLGAQMFAFEHDVNMMAISNRQGWRDAASDLVTHFDKSIQHGFANLTDVENGLANYMHDYSNTLPQTMSTTFSNSMKVFSGSLSNDNQTIINLSKRQLDELVKANDKNTSPVLNTTVSIDGEGFSNVVAGQFVRAASTPAGQQALANSATRAATTNMNRQALGRTLSGSGGV